MSEYGEEYAEIDALAFDVGGTVLDWHGGVSRAAAELGTERGISADWGAFANSWRRLQLKGMLGEGMDGETKAEFRGLNIDGVTRAVLDQALAENGIGDFDDDDKNELALAWHCLPAWPDAAQGHARLSRNFIMSMLTILSVSLIVDVSRLAPFQWDSVISCEMLGLYKPKPEVYQLGAYFLAIPPERILMVAAHSFDLLAAAEQGYRTAFIRRPLEWGPGGPVAEPDPSINLVATGLDDLADQMGA